MDPNRRVHTCSCKDNQQAHILSTCYSFPQCSNNVTWFEIQTGDADIIAWKTCMISSQFPLEHLLLLLFLLRSLVGVLFLLPAAASARAPPPPAAVIFRLGLTVCRPDRPLHRRYFFYCLNARPFSRQNPSGTCLLCGLCVLCGLVR